MSNFVLFLRSLIFAVGMFFATVSWAFVCFFAVLIPMSYEKRYFITSLWNRFIIWYGELVCGMRYRVIGRENLPDYPVILLAKHQSAWETIFLFYQMPRPLVYVLKKELLYIPLFGWALAMLRMVPIDRSNGKDAFAQVAREGRKRLQDGQWIIMFPEGTRTPVGGQGRYKGGGARLAVETNTPVVPIALNAGECWPRNSFIKRPGLITVSIGKPIPVNDSNPVDLMLHVENWIESEMRVISPHVYTNEKRA